MKIKAIFWDFSGVIILAKEGKPQENLLRSLGIPIEWLYSDFMLALDRRHDMGEIDNNEYYANIFAFHNIPYEQTDFMHEFFMKNLSVNYELLKYIQFTSTKVKNGVLSNFSTRLRSLIEKELKIAHYFDDLIVSSEVRMVKPEKDIFLLASERFGLNPDEIIFVDDRQENVEGAEATGMKALLFQSNTQIIKSVNEILGISFP